MVCFSLLICFYFKIIVATIMVTWQTVIQTTISWAHWRLISTQPHPFPMVTDNTSKWIRGRTQSFLRTERVLQLTGHAKELSLAGIVSMLKISEIEHKQCKQLEKERIDFRCHLIVYRIQYLAVYFQCAVLLCFTIFQMKT